jgi:hypothetical protein
MGGLGEQVPDLYLDLSRRGGGISEAREAMDRIRDILLYVVAAFAMLSFACAVYQAMNEKVGSALALAGLAVACTLLVFFPRLEVFKAYGVEARLSQTLDRAEEILQKLQRLSVISARTSYMTMAWGNRMGTPNNRLHSGDTRWRGSDAAGVASAFAPR